MGGLNLKKTLARSSVTILTKKVTIQPSALRHLRQKTSNGPGNLRVGNWGLQRGSRGDLRPVAPHLLSVTITNIQRGNYSSLN